MLSHSRVYNIVLIFRFCVYWFCLFLWFSGYSPPKFPAALPLTSQAAVPIIEDGAKAIAVRGEYGAVYNVIFNAFEFSSYISMFSLNRYSIGKGILVRIPAIAMHSINTFIQYLTTNEKFQKILHINKDDEESKKKLRVIGQILSTLIHAIYNSLGVRYNNNIMDFMTT